MIKVLVVDDSVLMRKIISDLLQSDPEIEVVATAKDGRDAIEKAARFNPDVITMDVEMPEMDGIQAVEYIMRENPLPIVMLSALTKEGAKETLQALEYGAVDFIQKPSGTFSPDLPKIAEEIVAKVRTAAGANIMRPRAVAPEAPPADVVFEDTGEEKLVVIGASTGGPSAIYEILSALPENFPAGILIVQHMPLGFTKPMAQRLDSTCPLTVKEAADTDRIVPGMVYVAPGNRHMLVNQDRIFLDDGPKVHGVRPSVDVTMKSASQHYGSNLIGIILTGMGTDGTEGIESIKKRGGRTIAQDEATSTIFGMPKAAIATGAVDKVLPLQEIPAELISMVGG
ncbi:MAG: chemotaxis response regulator protein-glutamate methylesterase [Euryarchaeota archaeon]|nr:chemotaxis response regulator protein-glutamate methylesterase [Euryarchaeota archaeon]